MIQDKEAVLPRGLSLVTRLCGKRRKWMTIMEMYTRAPQNSLGKKKDVYVIAVSTWSYDKRSPFFCARAEEGFVRT